MARAFYVEVKTKGTKPLEWLRRVNDRIHFEFQQRLVELGEDAAEKMRSTIKASIKRDGSTGRLENSINSHLLKSTGGVHIGIGYIPTLPPYWEVINDGGYIPPANLGFFGNGTPPIAGGTGEKWTHTGEQGDFYMQPKTPISPVKYIEISEQDLTRHIHSAINRLMRETKQI